MARVLFVLNSASGGAAVSARDLMRELRQHGHRCFAVLPPGASADEMEALRQVSEEHVTMPLPWWNRKYKAKLWKRPLHWGWNLWRSGGHLGSLLALRRCLRRWDIELVHTNTSLNLQGALVAAWSGVPHVWHIREHIGHRRLFRFWLPEPLLARTFESLSDALVVNSETSAELFRRHHRDRTLRVIYNGVDLDLFAGGAEERAPALRKSWGAGEEEPVVAMVAHLSSRVKRHDVFVRAVAQLAPRWPQARFVVVGTDPAQSGGYRSELEHARAIHDLARELKVDQRILWAGALDDVPAVMNAVDLLVHPADRESFGRVAVEAMAAGKPVVAADAGGLREIVEDGVTGLRVPAGDADGFARAIEELLEQPQRRQALGQAGRRRVEERFSLTATGRDVDALYRSLMEAAA
ncbi:MAG: glycosyltransferase family 4 protein [Acidobacteriota bacterium]|nr:glycosyltransferase family 4 protein [Acidobacteriota bacterium]